MTLPVVLESFLPSLVIQPCAYSRVGVGTPAAFRRAGQYRQWKRMMSLPSR
jgi:hypothetical protein